MESVRASSNRQPLCPSRISCSSHKSVSLNAFDTPSVPAFIRSVRQRSWVVSHPRFWKFWIFKNIFENTNFISMVFFNVSRNKNFLSCADSGTWLPPPKERFWLLQNTWSGPHIWNSNFQRVPPLGSCPQRNTYRRLNHADQIRRIWKCRIWKM